MRKFTKARENRGKVNEEFELEVLDPEDELVTLKFHVTRPMHSAGITSLMYALKKDPASAIGSIAPQVARILDDKDGTPARWTGDVAEGETCWVGPDGQAYPVDDAEARAVFEMFESGSSRRRWVHLMDPENEEYGVDLDDLIAITEYMVEVSSKRPTAPPV